MNFHRLSLSVEYRDSQLPWMITVLSTIWMGIMFNKYIDSLACIDELRTEITGLKKEVNEIKKNCDEQGTKQQDLEAWRTVVSTECKDRRKLRRPVAFSANARQQQTSLKVHATLVYDDVIANLGDAYNGETGEFRCPKDGGGVYFFTATTMAFPAVEVETEIVQNGHSIPVNLYAGASKHRHNQGSNSVVLQLHAGDLVYVRVHFVYENVTSQMVKVWPKWSSFSGFRII